MKKKMENNGYTGYFSDLCYFAGSGFCVFLSLPVADTGFFFQIREYLFF